MSTPTTPPFALTPEVAERAAEVARLVAATHTVPGDSLEAGRHPLSDTALAERLRMPVSPELPLADWAMVRLAPEETLTAYQYGMLHCVEQVLAQVLAAPAFHPQLAADIAGWRGVFAAAALPADGWLSNPQHGVRRLLAALQEIACGWQPELGAAATAVRQQIQGWLAEHASAAKGWDDTVKAILIWQAGERARTERIEKRLVDSESGALRARRSRQLAARTLNQALAERLIGIEIADVLRDDWYQAMQWTLLSDGEQGQLWQRVKRVTGSLRWTLSPEIGDDARKNLMRVIGQLNDDIAALAPLVLHNDASRERVLDTLEAEHLRILRNEPRQTAPFVPVEGQDALADASTELSTTLLAPVQTLTPGQWVLLQDSAGLRRARLLLRQDDSQQLLFVNALGVKALQISWQGFALWLARGDATVLPAQPDIDAAMHTVRNELQARYERERNGRMEALRSAREQASAEARVREAARQKALAEAQQLEAARQEVVARAAAAEADASQLVRDADQQRQQRARLMASSLTVGAWLVFAAAATEPVRRKLTVVLPSSGKYIFVDAAGTSRFELARDELIRGLADGSISSLQKDQRLDDALTRVVDNLRQERGTPG